MPSAEDRQAKALESLDRSMKELVKVMIAMNHNFTVVGQAIKDALELSDARDQAQMALNLEPRESGRHGSE